MTSTKTARISFDFDDTIAEYSSIGWSGYELVCIPKFLQILQEYHALGCECIILTARSNQEKHIQEIDQFMKDHGIEDAVSYTVYTNHQPKGPFAFALGVDLHYDDSEVHLESVRSFGIKVVSTKSDDSESSLTMCQRLA